MISQETIDEIIDRANLVEVISENIQLRRSGSNFTGLCPFHNEKTPSFNVREGATYYKCFGCGASGNVITFIMEQRGCSFPEAVEELASRYGIEVKTEGRRSNRKSNIDRNELYRINHLAFAFYQECLKKAPVEIKKYIEERNLSQEILKKYGIGFAPKSWSSLTDFLKKKKVSETNLLSLGLSKRSRSGELIDAFRARLIFPIWIDTKRIAGFGGRIIPDLV